MGADGPGFESWSRFCFYRSGLSFPLCTVGLRVPVPLPRLSQELKETEDDSMSTKSAKHDRPCQAIFRVGGLGPPRRHSGTVCGDTG